VSTIDSYKLFPDGTFNTDPTINVESFVENFNKSEYKSVKAMIEDNQVMVVDDATPTCGISVPDQTSYGAVNDTVYWGRNDDLTLDEGFVHMGPCEVWCDDTRAQQDMNCQVTYTPASGKGAAPVPIDSSVCTSAKRLTFYWVAMHGPTWQVYSKFGGCLYSATLWKLTLCCLDSQLRQHRPGVAPCIRARRRAEPRRLRTPRVPSTRLQTTSSRSTCGVSRALVNAFVIRAVRTGRPWTRLGEMRARLAV
jgi:hypothetical protein